MCQGTCVYSNLMKSINKIETCNTCSKKEGLLETIINIRNENDQLYKENTRLKEQINEKEIEINELRNQLKKYKSIEEAVSDTQSAFPMSDTETFDTKQGIDLQEKLVEEALKEEEDLVENDLEVSKISPETNLLKENLSDDTDVSEPEVSQEKTREELLEENNELLEKVREYGIRLNMNSQNSNFSPSSDKFCKPSSLRKSTGNPIGAPIGHLGVSAKVNLDNAEQVECYPEECINCSNFEKCKKTGIFEKNKASRVVIDCMIEKLIKQYSLMNTMKCPLNKRPKAKYPLEARSNLQYSEKYTALITMLNTVGGVSYERIKYLLQGLFDISICEATQISKVSQIARKAEGINEKIKENLQQEPVLHVDETGIRINGKQYWVHCTCTDKFTHYTLHEKRGIEGIKANGVIEQFKGVAVHDFWKSYFNEGFENLTHAMCNVHLLRELNCLIESYPEYTWPAKMKKFLLDAKKQKEETKNQGKESFDEETLNNLLAKYDKITNLAEKECPAPEISEKESLNQLKKEKRAKTDESKPKKKRIKKSKARNLLERFIGHKADILRYLTMFLVPFGNNLAEQGARGIKPKTNVMDFKSVQGARDFLNIMSYVITQRKHGVNCFQAIQDLLAGKIPNFA